MTGMPASETSGDRLAGPTAGPAAPASSRARCARAGSPSASRSGSAAADWPGAARVLGGDDRDLPQDSQRPERDVLEVADGRGDQNSAPGMVGGCELLYHCGFAAMYSSEPLPHFVDDYLQLPAGGAVPPSRPSTASTRTTTCSRTSAGPAIEADLARSPGFARRLSDIDPAGLTDRRTRRAPVLADHIKARMFELEEVRTWERNPHLYARPHRLEPGDAGAVRVRAGQTERARRVLSKLRQVPRLIQAARDNVKDPPGIFVKVGIETFNGTLRFIERDLPRAFREVDDLHLLGDLADASTEAAHGHPRLRRLPRDRAGAEGARLVPAWAREVRAEAEARGRHRPRAPTACSRSPSASWPRRRRSSGAAGRAERRRSRGGLGAGQGEAPRAGRDRQRRAAADSTSSQQFVERQKLRHAPRQRAGRRRADARFLPLVDRQHVDAGPVRDQADAAPTTTSPTSIAAGAPSGRKNTCATSTTDALGISIHEVYPGHFLQYQHLRQVESKVRKSLFFAPAILRRRLGALLRADDDGGRLRARRIRSLKLGQLQEALIRLVRFVVGDPAARRGSVRRAGRADLPEEAFLEEANARREAERGTFDPTYLVYSVGKLMLQKLRQDVKAQQGAKLLAAHRSTTRCSSRAPRRSALTGR